MGLFGSELHDTEIHPRSVQWFVSPMWGASQESITAVTLNQRQDRALVGGFFRGTVSFLHDTGRIVEQSKGDASTDTVIASVRLSGTLQPTPPAPSHGLFTAPHDAHPVVWLVQMAPLNGEQTVAGH